MFCILYFLYFSFNDISLCRVDVSLFAPALFSIWYHASPVFLYLLYFSFNDISLCSRWRSLSLAKGLVDFLLLPAPGFNHNNIFMTPSGCIHLKFCIYIRTISILDFSIVDMLPKWWLPFCFCLRQDSTLTTFSWHHLGVNICIFISFLFVFLSFLYFSIGDILPEGGCFLAFACARIQP